MSVEFVGRDAPAKFRVRVRREGAPDRWVGLGDDRKSLRATNFIPLAYVASRESMEAVARRMAAKSPGLTYIVEAVE